jgi:peptidoglycan/LPS O-acetylase OafA/YrhL
MPATRLADVARGKDNNFNLIRIIAALAVLVTHSFALATGSADAEPLKASLDMTMGTIAVDVFFVTSGFLVTSSLLIRQSTIEFLWARSLRIFPALWVMVTLSVFGLGVFFTSMSLTSYFADHKTHAYLLKCSTLIFGVVYPLPGVFNGNPWKSAVNGSLWTMPYELRMYAILIIVWTALRIAKASRSRAFQSMIVGAAGLSGVGLVATHFISTAEQFAWLFFMFFSGAAFHVLKERITLSPVLFWSSALALSISAVANKDVFFLVYIMTIAYVLFYVAYVPSGLVRQYNRLGDYSYGVYIYAFPVQQSIAALMPRVSVLSMVLISTAITLSLAVISWHFLERRVLHLKQIYVGHTRRIFSYRPPDQP